MTVTFDVDGLQALIDMLRDQGFAVMAPTVRHGAIVHGEINAVAELPRGVGDEQDAAQYRLRERSDDLFFGFAAAAQSWKPLLFPAAQLVWRAQPPADGPDSEPVIEPAASSVQPKALLGVRSCDLHAIGIHDEILGGRQTADADYLSRRAGVFIVAVGCSTPGGTCFCASMGTGPRPDRGFDVALVEVLDGTGHRFVADAGTNRGAEVLAALPTRSATSEDAAAADHVSRVAMANMGRTMETLDIRDLLLDNPEHPRWDQVADRCLTCGNCTLVCPTCFCTTSEDVTDLTGSMERHRVWDSCFGLDFSYVHGGSVRTSAKSRYRQWMTHKLATWYDQFGSSGCVGCGRCITWCPAAIDITEEVAAIRTTPLAGLQERED